MEDDRGLLVARLRRLDRRLHGHGLLDGVADLLKLNRRTDRRICIGDIGLEGALEGFYEEIRRARKWKEGSRVEEMKTAPTPLFSVAFDQSYKFKGTIKRGNNTFPYHWLDR